MRKPVSKVVLELRTEELNPHSPLTDIAAKVLAKVDHSFSGNPAPK